MKILLLFILAISVSAQTTTKDGKKIDDWQLFYEGTDLRTGVELKAYYSPSSIRRGDDYTKAWLRADFPRGSKSLFTEWNGKEIGAFRGFAILRCTQHAVNGGSVIIYGMDGRIIHEENAKETAAETSGTLGQLLLDNFCEREAAIRSSAPPVLKAKP